MKPYIVSIGRHACIRQQKQAIALRSGALVHLLTEKRGSYQHFCQSAMLYANQHQLRAEIRLHERADIFHIHTEPFWFVHAVREIIPDANIVLDLHDSMYFRFDDPSKHSAEERSAIEMADALVYVSEECRSLIEGWIPSSKNKPYIVLPSYVPERFYKLNCWGRQGGIVNEGRMDSLKEGKWYDYCKYHDLAKALKGAGIPFYLYGGSDKEALLKEYSDAEWMGYHPYEEMIKQLGHYDWGLCGNFASFEEWQVAMPNKLFEYLAGGIPVIAMNAEAVGNFVEKHGIGIKVSSIQEIKDRWDERERCQANVYKKRWQWAMERRIYVLEDLYELLLHARGDNHFRKIPDKQTASTDYVSCKNIPEARLPGV